MVSQRQQRIDLAIYASWWLTLAISALIYWLLGLLFRKLKKSTPV